MNRISPAEPVTQLRHVPIVESGQPLVDFLELCPLLLLDRPRFHYRRETKLRLEVAERLCQAAHALPSGYRLAIVEGWRPPYIQERMYKTGWQRIAEMHPEWSDAAIRRTVNRYSAPMNRRVPPPHTTGGAVDLALVDLDGKMLDHHSPYEPFDPKGFHANPPGLSEMAQRTRQILYDALTSAGITNYPSEYWHWSYGDQGWAYRGGHTHAIYGPITPDGWEPDPADAIDAPLEWVQE
jgi:D-alanyl-D-alanine dipeptidase